MKSKNKNVYDQMRNELEKGKSLLVIVDEGFVDKNYKVRLVTPETCEYTYTYDAAACNYFNRSCFINGLRRKDPKGIIRRMKQYDKRPHPVHQRRVKLEFVVL